jgi:hypothetical protein
MATINYWGLSKKGSVTVNLTVTIDQLITAIATDEVLATEYYTVSSLADPSKSSLTFGDSSTTLTQLGLVDGGTVLCTTNQTGSKQERQLQKLAIAAKTRTVDGYTRATLDVTQLPTLYSGNTVVDNANSGGLVVGRPWTAVPAADPVLYLDAGNASSYPGSGTTWTDLSGNGRDGTLTNGPTYSAADGGSIVFDGTNDFVQCTGSVTATEATFIAWIRRNGTQGQYDGVLFSRGTSVTGMQFQSSNQLGYIWNNAVNTYNWNSGLTVPDLTWCMVAVSVTSTSATAYLCQSGGITSATNTVSHTSTTLDDIKIGQEDFGSRYFGGNIAIARLYDTALSAGQISQLFDADKARFGY